MKKIMIVAAIAAIAGGAFAEGYNFQATLKTTQGRNGSATITPLNLGQNLMGKFWYEDDLYADIIASNANWSATKVIPGASGPVPTVAKTKTKDGTTKDMTGTYLLVADSTNYAFAVSALKTLANIYDQRSAGKWCETIKVIDPASCYRVAGTKKIDQDFIWEDGDYWDCCTEFATWTVAAGAFTNGLAGGETAVAPVTSFVFDNGAMGIAYSTNQVTAPLSAANTLYQRFGAQTSDRATRLEIYAGIPYAYTTDGYLFAGWIAGQGTAFARDGMAANTISGNIVGVIEAPACENCCTAPTPSWAFDCANDDVSAQLPYSAAYGTFRMRFVRNLR